MVTAVARPGICEYSHTKTSLYFVSKHMNADHSVGESAVDKNIGQLSSRSTCFSSCSCGFGLSW